MTMRALVLSGGGAKGAYEAGLVSTLISEFHEQFDIVCGTSIGAINAAFFASDDLAGLTDLWHTIAAQQIVAPFPRIRALQQLFGEMLLAFEHGGFSRMRACMKAVVSLLGHWNDVHPLSALASMTGLIDPAHTRKLLDSRLDLTRLKRILLTTATDLATQCAEVFYAFPDAYVAYREHFLTQAPDALPFDAAHFSEIVRASGAIPAAFSPVALSFGSRNGAYVDGGVVNNTPIGQAIDAGAEEITVIYLDPLPCKANTLYEAPNIVAVLSGCFAIMQQRILDLDYQTALRVNDAVGASAHDTQDKRIVRLRTFRPYNALSVGVLDFDKQQLVDAAFEAGCGDARSEAARNAWQM